jgi:hypothetical protein
LALAQADPGSTSITVAFPNPTKINSLTELLETLLDGLLIVAIPIIVLLIIYSGFLFISAQGNPPGIDKAKKVLTMTLIGAAVILGARVIYEVVESTVCAFMENPSSHCESS